MRLLDEEIGLARKLETAGLLFMVGATAVVTPRARRPLAELAKKPPKPPNPPFSLLE
jgi:hypothetical protein